MTGNKPSSRPVDRYYSKVCCCLVGILLISSANLFFFLEHNKHLNGTTSEGGAVSEGPSTHMIDHGKTKRWNRAMVEAKEMLAAHGEEAECLHPKVQESKKLLKQFQGNRRPSKPYLNMGFPKCGSSTLFDFFACLGYRATHFTNNSLAGDFEGICMRDAVANGLRPLETCARGVDAILQMDVEYPLGIDGYFHKPFRDECFFPQFSLLEELHQEAPASTFLLTFRPIHDWITSISGWGSTVMLNRFQLCDFPNLPRGIPTDLGNKTQVVGQMTEFWCSHVQHVRNFVKEYPSHTLIETSLYDNLQSAQIMYGLFPTKVDANNTSEPITTELSNGCWGHSNENRPKQWLRRRKGKQGRNWLQKEQQRQQE
ncbi:unnamed protein product [Cylindrotheca closterium]|uniref:Sulfotransferase n=1 Tax=Cylindrotheca closterium TaxID=2856 RepID=A0AAD2PUK4_9STRA|nr:unnamed protein product [Cylindrotheca closterium]